MIFQRPFSFGKLGRRRGALCAPWVLIAVSPQRYIVSFFYKLEKEHGRLYRKAAFGGDSGESLSLSLSLCKISRAKKFNPEGVRLIGSNLGNIKPTQKSPPCWTHLVRSDHPDNNIICSTRRLPGVNRKGERPQWLLFFLALPVGTPQLLFFGLNGLEGGRSEGGAVGGWAAGILQLGRLNHHWYCYWREPHHKWLIKARGLIRWRRSRHITIKESAYIIWCKMALEYTDRRILSS